MSLGSPPATSEHETGGARPRLAPADKFGSDLQKKATLRVDNGKFHVIECHIAEVVVVSGDFSGGLVSIGNFCCKTGRVMICLRNSVRENFRGLGNFNGFCMVNSMPSDSA